MQYIFIFIFHLKETEMVFLMTSITAMILRMLIKQTMTATASVSVGVCDKNGLLYKVLSRR